jgi:hypothetical protein
LSVKFFTCGFSADADVVRKVVLYVVARLKEVDVKRLMYVMYFVEDVGSKHSRRRIDEGGKGW